MEKICLYWYARKNRPNNFGDALNPYLISKISGKKVQYLPVVGSKANRLKSVIKGILKGYFGSSVVLDYLKSYNTNMQLAAIGSILEHLKGKDCHVWGAGIINKESKVEDLTFHAVRGKESQKRILELGFDAPDVIGDPALLLPLVYHPKVQKTHRLGIIPHFVQYDETLAFAAKHNLFIIDVNDSIETVVRNILSCEVIISSSLHGIIVSHAYGIPCLWYQLPGGRLYGDNTKFNDYFSSVDIDPYEPFNIYDWGDGFSSEEIVQNVLDACKIETILNNISLVQQDLLRVAPFPIQEKFKH